MWCVKLKFIFGYFFITPVDNVPFGIGEYLLILKPQITK